MITVVVIAFNRSIKPSVIAPLCALFGAVALLNTVDVYEFKIKAVCDNVSACVLMQRQKETGTCLFPNQCWSS